MKERRDVADHHREMGAACGFAASLQRRHHRSRRWSLGEPSVTEFGGASDGGFARAGNPDRWPRRLHRSGPRAEAIDELILERLDEDGKRFVDHPPTSMEIDPQLFELGLHVSGTYTSERSAAVQRLGSARGSSPRWRRNSRKPNGRIVVSIPRPRNEV